MIKSISKLLLVFTLVISLASCGTIVNWRNPSEIKTKEELEQAQRIGLIKGYNRYIVGNFLLLPFFGIGFIGFVLDYWTNSNYKVTDKQSYDKWLQKKQEKAQKEREELLAD